MSFSEAYAAMTVTVPEGVCGALRVERFEAIRHSAESIRLESHGRPCAPGTYTRLMEGRRLWMSDTDAEKRDHLDALLEVRRTEARRVLINGLGLGMVLAGVLSYGHVEHVDVVEKDARVIELVGPHYAGPRVSVHHADAYEQARQWPPGTTWDVAWHDIWPDLCTDNLKGMARLHRSYGRRVQWQGSWGRDLLRRQQEIEKRQRMGWY
jgi:hypothetical protein